MTMNTINYNYNYSFLQLKLPYHLLTTVLSILCLSSFPANISCSSPSPTIFPTRIPTTRTCSDSDLKIVSQNGHRRRFIFQGPILTLTLKDPFADETVINTPHNQNKNQNHQKAQTPSKEHSFSSSLSSSFAGTNSNTNTNNNANNNAGIHNQINNEDENLTSSKRKRHYFWSRKYNPSSYSNILNLNSLAPTLLYSVRSINRPFPYYLPWLQSTSITTGYKYDDVKDKPSFIEGEFKFRKRFGGSASGSSIESDSGGSGGGGFSNTANMAIDVDIGPSYSVREKKAALVVRIGGDNGGGDGFDDEASGFGCFGLVRFVMSQGKKVCIL